MAVYLHSEYKYGGLIGVARFDDRKLTKRGVVTLFLLPDFFDFQQPEKLSPEAGGRIGIGLKHC